VLDGELLRTMASELSAEDLATLTMRGARPAGPAPGKPALRRLNGLPSIAAGHAVEIDRRVTKNGNVTIARHVHLVGSPSPAAPSHCAWTASPARHRRRRPNRHLALPNPRRAAARLSGARSPSTLRPPPPLPAGSLRVQRRVHASGKYLVAKQYIKLGKRHAGKLVTVVIEDTHLRVLHDG
jgi:hypothetical protein